MVAAPDVENEQGLAHGSYALLVFALPLLGAALLEALVALVSDRQPRARVVGAGLVVTSLALALCAHADQGVVLALGLALAGAASGAACSAAQGELVASDPAGGARAMMRWVLFGGVGDVLTPLLVALILRAGGSYRAAFLGVAGHALLHGVLLLANGRGRSAGAGARLAGDAGASPTGLDAVLPPAAAAGSSPSLPVERGPDARASWEPEPDPTALDPEEDSAPLLEALREQARNSGLWLWLLGAALCTFLDEIVVAFAALHAERDLGVSAAVAVACVTGASAGEVVGAWLSERVLRTVSPDPVLAVSAAAALASLVAVVFAPTALTLALALIALGVSVAPQYALLKARAYAAAPGRPGVVNALAQVFVIVDVAGPLALGVLADRLGVAVALACLGVQPLAVLALAVWAGRRGRRARGAGSTSCS